MVSTRSEKPICAPLRKDSLGIRTTATCICFVLRVTWLTIFFPLLQTGMQSTAPCISCAPWSRPATGTMATLPQHCCPPLSPVSSLIRPWVTTAWRKSSPDTTTVSMHSATSSESFERVVHVSLTGVNGCHVPVYVYQCGIMGSLSSGLSMSH